MHFSFEYIYDSGVYKTFSIFTVFILCLRDFVIALYLVAIFFFDDQISCTSCADLNISLHPLVFNNTVIHWLTLASAVPRNVVYVCFFTMNMCLFKVLYLIVDFNV